MRVQIIAHLMPGVTLAQARSEAEVIASQFKKPSAEADRTERFVVEDFGEMFHHPGPTPQNAQSGLWMTAVASGGCPPDRVRECGKPLAGELLNHAASLARTARDLESRPVTMLPRFP